MTVQYIVCGLAQCKCAVMMDGQVGVAGAAIGVRGSLEIGQGKLSPGSQTGPDQSRQLPG